MSILLQKCRKESGVYCNLLYICTFWVIKVLFRRDTFRDQIQCGNSEIGDKRWTRTKKF